MEEEITLINGTKHTFRAKLVEVIEYVEKQVRRNDFRVFDRDITPVKREFKIIIEEVEEE